MDRIEAFEFYLDIANQDTIYDYVAKETLKRPVDGKWDLSLFKGRGSLEHVPSEDENEKTRIHLLDKAIASTSLLEKKVSVDSEPAKSGIYQSIFDTDFGFEDPDGQTEYLPRRLLPVYHRGDVVKGHVLLKLKEPIEAKALKMKFVGEVLVSVRIYHQRGYYDETEQETFMKEKKILWQRSDGKSTDISDKFTLLATTEEPASSPMLNAGTHKFNFEYRIPDDAPQSVPPLVISSHNKGHLQWRFKAKIEVPGTIFKSGHVATHRGILVEYPLDVAADSERLTPVTVEESLGTGLLWNTGKVIMKAHLLKSGHVRGKDLQVRIDLENDSKGDVASISARVRLRGKAKTGTSKLSCSNTIDIKSTKVKEGAVPAGARREYTMVLPWDFSESSADGKMLPVGQLEESALLEVKYTVEITAKRKGLHRNVQMEIPIFVGTHDSSDDQ